MLRLHILTLYVVHGYHPQLKETPTKPMSSSVSCSGQRQGSSTPYEHTHECLTSGRQRTCDSHVYLQGNSGGGVEKYEVGEWEIGG